MYWEYAAYLIFTLLGALLIRFAFKPAQGVLTRPFLGSLLITAVIFISWDVWAVYLGHWTFGLTHMLGFMVLNQPIEEILFFFVIPFFYLTCWLILRERFS